MLSRHTDSRLYFSRLLSVFTLAFMSTATAGPRLQNDGIDIAQLRAFADSKPGIEFVHLRENPSVAGERREVVSFESDGLVQYALVLWPAGERPETGWPVLLFNHGYHPNPPDYGRIEGGVNSRPGDYYRGTAQAFVDNGYVVVTPDYRGHNDSEGADYTRHALAVHWYTRDAIAAYFGLASLDGIDHQRVYMLGHSMGGPITQRALLALNDRIRAASVWSSGSGEHMLSFWMDMSIKELGNTDNSGTVKPPLDRLARELAQLGPDKSLEDLSIGEHLAGLEVPLAIQHAKGDATTDVNGSLELAARLYLAGREYQLFLYDSDEHLFSGDDFDQAVERDLQWFESHR
jgi:dipeptidyl aminopeptidase/acylaminoacyl peptidase